MRKECAFMDTRTEEGRAYVEALVSRLRRQYVARALLPAAENEERQLLSFELLKRLCHHVVAEGYGEDHSAGE
jgi:hypothetical protein